MLLKSGGRWATTVGKLSQTIHFGSLSSGNFEKVTVLRTIAHPEAPIIFKIPNHSFPKLLLEPKLIIIGSPPSFH